MKNPDKRKKTKKSDKESEFKETKETSIKSKPKNKKKSISTIPEREETNIQTDNNLTTGILGIKLNSNYQNKSASVNNNLNLISQQVQNCDKIIELQDGLFKKISNLNKKILNNNLSFERSVAQCESENYFNLFQNYSNILEELLIKLKGQLEEIETLQAIREENSNIKMKMELSLLNLQEEKVKTSSKFECFKNFVSLEFNNFTDFINDSNNSNNTKSKLILNRFNTKNIDENSISVYFQSVKQYLRAVFREKENYHFSVYDNTRKDQPRRDFVNQNNNDYNEYDNRSELKDEKQAFSEYKFSKESTNMNFNQNNPNPFNYGTTMSNFNTKKDFTDYKILDHNQMPNEKNYNEALNLDQYKRVNDMKLNYNYDYSGSVKDNYS